MKFGTLHKAVAGIAALILLGFITTLWFISVKEDSVAEVEIVISSPKEFSDSAAQTRTARKTEIAVPLPADTPSISAAELQQIEDFFAQLEDLDVQSPPDEPKSSLDVNVMEDSDEQLSDDSGANQEHPAEQVMNKFVDAFRDFDLETVLPYTTENARKPIENLLSVLGGVIPEKMLNDHLSSIDDGMSETEIDEAVESVYKAMDSIRSPENLAKWRRIFRQTQIVSSEYVGDEFQFRLTVPLPDRYSNFGLVVSMQKVDGEWRIYRMKS